MLSRSLKKKALNRRAAVAVEFAMIMPFLATTALGLVEVSRLYDMQNLLEMGARDGARFAAMDRTGLLGEGQATNAKIISDVTNFMVSSGILEECVTVTIRDAENPEQGFDLDDPENDLKLFVIEVSVPFSAASFSPIGEASDFDLTGSITFRNGRATISE